MVDFARFFGDGGIRTLLDWRRLEAECRIEATTSRSRVLLGDLRTVWYNGPDGRDREFRDADARPLRVRETGRTEASWPEGRAARIAEFEARFRGDGGPIQLTLPVYALGDDEFLLLDGTHRAVAAHRTGGNVRLALFAVHGPVDEAMLPDLRHASG
ncbi:hypothetical protein VA596_34650 [Amycolatopsis sp., V23-08]|uniref:ParB/Sulfiredoxin domain-containing protein n=1 Tax=Amycolatopsis heterodermiae TaxID=3110235 RepID=A0ABU5RFV0_9PSEU|nr:hypothetical protein [Amycolatopsis sp., V23-08]MEA5364715.1 hypothetical protein [Amycolatopsis sp., V23-08]